MAKILYLLLLQLPLIYYPVYSQTSDAEATQMDDAANHHLSNSRFSVYSGMGALEFFTFGIQYRVAEHHEIGVKYSSYLTSGEMFIFPLTGRGPGLTWSYFYEQERVFNTIDAELTYMKSISHAYHPKYGVGAELTTGHKNYNEKGIHFFWLVGVSASWAPIITDVYSPALKIGANYNL